MKTAKLNNLSRGILLGILSIFLTFSFSSCAKNYSFMVSSVVPAARGKVKITRDHNRNYVINVSLYNLAEVERLQSSKRTYVVWIVSDDNKTINIGQLKSSTKLFSKQLKASLKAASSTKPATILITAEDDPGVLSPGSEFILTTSKL
jgi:FlaG/FlaF family flagellin (archaellin)